MNSKELCSLLEDVLEQPAGSLRPEVKLDGQTWWDSMATLGIMAAVEEKYSISLTPRDIIQCKTVADFIKLINGA